MTVLPELSFQEISQYFHLPISQAAKELKVCETLLKKICRVNGIKRWPHRKIRSIDTMINLLEFRIQSEKLSEKEKNRMRNEIADLIEKKSFFMNSPNTTYQSIIPKNTLQSFSKTKLKNQKSFSQFLNEEAKKPDSALATHNSLLSTMNSAGNSGGFSVISNLRSKNRRTRKQKNEEYDSDSEFEELRIDEDGDDSDYVDNNDGSNINYLKRSKRSKKEMNENDNADDDDNDDDDNNNKIKEINNENLEEEEEEVLNVLCSFKQKEQSEEVNPPIDNGTNELYKLSLLAILNPMNADDIINNNKLNDKENNRVKEVKKRNVLRRSSDNFDKQSLHSDIKRRKFDRTFSNNLEFSVDPNNSFHFHSYPAKEIKL